MPVLSCSCLAALLSGDADTCLEWMMHLACAAYAALPLQTLQQVLASSNRRKFATLVLLFSVTQREIQTKQQKNNN